MLLFTFGIVLSGILGALISYYYSSRKSAYCLIREHKVLDPVEGELPPEVKITFSGEEVKTLSEWKIFLWNSGNQTISKEDLADGFLNIILENLRIVGTPVISGSREVISPEIVKDGQYVRLTFSYLDRGDSVGVTVYTSTPDESEDPQGNEEYEYDVTLQGHVKGIPSGVKFKAEDDPVAYKDVGAYFSMAMFFAVVAYILLMIVLNVGQSLELWQVYQETNYKLVAKAPWLRWIQFLLLPFAALFAIAMTVYGAITAITGLSSVPKFVRENSR